ncbi:unnamed protein product [Mytilus coruscus]|uniref:Uncharacterized protein n=1 Tax=Mytilus coruscus TaxID=42192 RepID=A0A6J8CLU0_MYTCO|nr:unnamed protein product [Mytilus coruscus]
MDCVNCLKGSWSLLSVIIQETARTLKPYKKKFRRQGEYRYDLPLQSRIPDGHPKVCYDRRAKVNQRACEPEPKPKQTESTSSTSNASEILSTSSRYHLPENTTSEPEREIYQADKMSAIPLKHLNMNLGLLKEIRRCNFYEKKDYYTSVVASLLTASLRNEDQEDSSLYIKSKGIQLEKELFNAIPARPSNIDIDHAVPVKKDGFSPEEDKKVEFYYSYALPFPVCV